jgi:hypothetical protein
MVVHPVMPDSNEPFMIAASAGAETKFMAEMTAMKNKVRLNLLK